MITDRKETVVNLFPVPCNCDDLLLSPGTDFLIQDQNLESCIDKQIIVVYRRKLSYGEGDSISRVEVVGLSSSDLKGLHVDEGDNEHDVTIRNHVPPDTWRNHVEIPVGDKTVAYRMVQAIIQYLSAAPKSDTQKKMEEILSAIDTEILYEKLLPIGVGGAFMFACLSGGVWCLANI